MFYIILCEGKTDSAIINQIMSEDGFEYLRDGKTTIGKKFNPKLIKNQEIDFFKRGEEILGIYNISGSSNLKYTINEIEKLVRNEVELDYLAIVTDMDFQDSLNIESDYSNYFRDSLDLKNDIWKNYKFQDEFGTEKCLKILLKIVPKDRFGALETILLEALKKSGQEERVIGDSVEELIDKLKEDRISHLEKERYVIKSKLGCLVNILDPERTFKDILPVFSSITWTKYEVVQNNFTVIKNYKEADL